MTSTFHGLETARRGMATQQSALYTVGHNIANANTPGYTRQRVNFVQTEPYPSAAINRPDMPGQIGTGVETGSVQRMRDSFLDVQFRGENSKLGYWDSRAQALERMEGIMNEPSDTGLANVIDRFWQSWQDLAVDPSNAGAREVVQQRGIAVAETFNYISDSLQAIQNDLQNELSVTEKEINSLADQINDINRQIADVEPHGYLPNDLYDERDRLLDQLSSLVNIKVTNTSSGGQALDIAEGKVTVHIVDSTGNQIGTLVDGKFDIVNELSVNYSNDGLVESVDLGSQKGIAVEDFGSVGSFVSLIESYGYQDRNGTPKVGVYPEMLQKIDEMAYQFAMEINRVHQSGWNITDINDGTHNGVNFFENLTGVEGAASALKVDDVIMASIDNIAAAADKSGLVVEGGFSGNIGGTAYGDIRLEIAVSNGVYSYSIYDSLNNPIKTNQPIDDLANDLPDLSIDISHLDSGIANGSWTFNISEGSVWDFAFSSNGPDSPNLGDGDNALALAEVKNRLMNIGGDSTTIQNYYEGIIGEMAVDTQEAERLAYNSSVLRDSVETNRQSVSAVSLDEEMTNMITFQHAYNASARMITLTDEILDKVINGLGIGGR
ncbi:flagellar hook-associated protein FlgK [Cytobacillus sp. IB215665]|uniref:flagellar hook-associated protein FlgK n=1 Tax=Cytobacillus sp. IB215665 TaxID=3097357 RepID=UPI002A0C0BD4|nr:flagellar hook-associated protein FlgK [Cytobacillus sp. IB215665]MDX8363820.1 flagellar hook-associated protein FlgK [Cytobacillus sp. IB215665]